MKAERDTDREKHGEKEIGIDMETQRDGDRSITENEVGRDRERWKNIDMEA